MPSTTTYVAFAGPRQIAAGPLEEVLPVLKRRFDADRADLPLVFEVETGRQVDFDLRGTLDDVLVRATPPRRTGPGRPRLGVSGREVTLLPRHWQWLDAQPGGASAARMHGVGYPGCAAKCQPILGFLLCGAEGG